MESSLFNLNFSPVSKNETQSDAIVSLISYGENSYKTFVGVTYENINEPISITKALNNYGDEHIISSLIFINGDISVNDLNIQGNSENGSIFSHYWQNILKDILFTDGFKDKISHLMVCNPKDTLLYDVDDLDNAYHIIKNSGEDRQLTDNDAPF